MPTIVPRDDTAAHWLARAIHEDIELPDDPDAVRAIESELRRHWERLLADYHRPTLRLFQADAEA